MRSPFFLPLLLTLVAAFQLAAAKERETQRLPPPPPQPVPQTINVPRTGAAEVFLRIFGQQSEPLKFLIRTRPDHGRLSPMAPAGREAVRVTYQPPADLEVKTDSFTYAVQNSAGVSAPAEVKLMIIDDQARLIVPDELRFEPILAGTVEEQEFSIENQGGSLAAGMVEVEAPWQVKGKADYRLGRGERQRFTLIFAPQSGGAARRELRYSSHPDRVTTLLGEASWPLTVTPASLELQSTPGDPIRRAPLVLNNQTAEPIRLQVHAGSRLQAEQSVTVEAGAEEHLWVETAAGDVTPVQEELRLTGAGLEFRVPVTAPALPAMLKAQSARLELPAGSEATGSAALLEVQNFGAEAGYWRVEAGAPFAVSPEELRVPAQARERLRVQLGGRAPGHFGAPLRITGEQQTVTVLLEAELTPGRVSRATPSGPAGASLQEFSAAAVSTGGGGEVAAAAGEAAEPANPPNSGGQPQFAAVNVGETHATLEWPETLAAGREVKVEVQQLSLNGQHKLAVEWLPLSDASVTTANGRTRAELPHLPRALLHHVRVSAVDPATKTAKVLFTFQLRALPQESLFEVTPTRGLAVAAVVCAAAAGWQFYRRRRPPQGGR